MFLTWRLWKALQHPPRQQAIYRYVLKLSNKQTGFTVIARIMLAIFCLSILGIGFINPSILFGLIFLSITLIPIGLLVFNSTIQGLYWFRNASQQISNIQGTNQFELIYLTPHSTLGIVWMIAIGCVNRGTSFRRITRVIQAVVLIILGMLSIFIAILIWNYFTATTSFQQAVATETLSILLYFGFFAIGMWLDYIQSLITSLLLAMLAPTYTKDNFFLSNIFPIFFLLVQVGIYLVTTIVFIVFQTIFTGLFGASILSIFGISSITLLSFYFTRESVISLMWQVMQTRYDARLDLFLEDVN